MRTWRWLAAGFGAATAVGIAVACSDADQNTDQRGGTRGCVGDACFEGGVVPPGSSSGGEGGPPDGGYPNPIDGTSKSATLVKGGFSFTEGPVWIGGRLLFSDNGANSIHELLADGGTQRFRADAGGANGNAVDNAGKLVTCEGANQRMVRSDATKGAGVNSIADTYNGNPFNSPNDVIVRGDGNVYFTDPNYTGNPNTQDAEAVYRISPQGDVSRIDHAFQKPNGIALSPDGNTLYVVDNGAGQLFAAHVNGDGTVANNFVKVCDTPGGDGMAVDDANNLYVADTGGVDVFDVTGAKLGTITVAEQPANCTFGGSDRRMLYITARKGLYSLHTNVPGLP